MKFKRHRFLYIILSKNHTGKDGECIVPSQVYSHRDFSERLKLEFNNQVQEEYYAGGATVSLEGVAVKFFPSADDTTTMEFHSYFSDGKQQDSSVVHNHMTKLIQYLKVNKILATNGTLLCTTDGCAAQYRSGTAYYLLSALSVTHGIVIQRSIQAPGHGKGEKTCLYYLNYILILTDCLLSSLLFL